MSYLKLFKNYIDSNVYSYPKPEKLDVYYNGLYIYPRNSELDKDGNHVTKAPTKPGQYLPPINSSEWDKL